jgi:hypothetical protein
VKPPAEKPTLLFSHEWRTIQLRRIVVRFGSMGRTSSHAPITPPAKTSTIGNMIFELFDIYRQ